MNRRQFYLSKIHAHELYDIETEYRRQGWRDHAFAYEEDKGLFR